MASGSYSGVYRGFTVVTNWSSTPNVSGNYSTITCNHYLVCNSYSSLYINARTNSCTVDGSAKSFGSSAISTGGGSTIHLGTTTHTVYHNSDGKKSVSASTVFNIQATINSTYVESITASGTMTLDNIPRQATLTSAPDFNDEQNPTIKYENKAGDSLEKLQACISLTGQTDDIKYRDIPKTGTSYTFELTEDERNVLRNATTSNSRKVRFYIRSVIGGVSYHSEAEKTLTIVNATPTTGTFTYKDNNETTTKITGNNQRIIRNNSDLLFTFGNATALKGATISSYEVSFAGVSQGITSAGSINFGKVNLSNNANATLKVTDSRGNTATKEITVIIDDWVLPTGLITLNRKNNFYSETYLKVDASYSSLNGKNDITIRCQYRIEYNTEYSELPELENNVQGTYDFDNNFKWYLKILITDKIGTTTYNIMLDRGMPIIFFDRLLSSVGINCFPSTKDNLYMNGLPVSNTTFAQMFTKGEKSIDNGVLTLVDSWKTDGNVMSGKFSCEPTNKRLVIPAGSAEYIEISGNIAGYGSVYGYLSLSDSSSAVDSIPFLVPTNNYFSIPIASRVIKIPDKTKDYYVKLEVQGYNGANFIVNNGFGDGATYISAKKIL